MGGGSERGEGFRRIDLAVDDIFVIRVLIGVKWFL